MESILPFYKNIQSKWRFPIFKQPAPYSPTPPFLEKISNAHKKSLMLTYTLKLKEVSHTPFAKGGIRTMKNFLKNPGRFQK